MIKIRVKIKPRGGWLYIHYNDQTGRHRDSLGLRDTKQNRTLAEAIALKKESDIRRGIFEPGKFSPVTLDEAIEMFMHSKRKNKTNALNVYEISFKLLKAAVNPNKKVNEITEQDIDIFLEAASLKSPEQKLKDGTIKEAVYRSDNTVATYNNHVRMLFRYMQEAGYIRKNPLKHIEGKKTLIVTIPDEDWDTIVDFFSKPKRDDGEPERLTEKQAREEQLRFLQLLHLTGLRTGEAVNLKWEDIDYSRGVIKVRNEKEDRDDYVDLIPQIRDLLTPVRKRSGKIFPYTQDGLKFFPRAMKKLNMSYCLHDIRRTFGSRLANAGIKPLDLMAAMRHKNIKTTMRYYIDMDIKRIGGLISNAFNSKTDKPKLKTGTGK